jgi:hypothetical protein
MFPDDRAARPVHEPALVFAHVRARFDGAAALDGDRTRAGALARRAHLPRLSAARTARTLAANGFRTDAGDLVLAADLKRDGTVLTDFTGTILLESLSLGRRFYGLWVEPTAPTPDQWASVTGMFDRLGRLLDARLCPVDELSS